MTIKVNGAARPGVWFERDVAFVKVTFSKDVSALAAADLLTADGVAVGAGTVAASGFDVVGSALEQAIKTLETKATVLGVSKYDAATNSVDVILGSSEGWFSDATGVIGTAIPVIGASAVVTTAGAAPTDVVGATVKVADTAVTLDLKFATLNGTLPVGTEANGALVLGPGATSGAIPVNSATGTAGYRPGTI